MLVAAGICASPTLGALPGRDGPLVVQMNKGAYAAAPDGSGRRKIADPQGRKYWGVRWHQSGRKLLLWRGGFLYLRAGGRTRLIWQHRDPARTRSEEEGGWWIVGADWSPGGHRVVIAAVAEEGDELYVVGTRGGNARELPAAVGGKAMTVLGPPVWSPSGRMIAVQSSGPAEPPMGTITVMRPDGTGRRIVANQAYDWVGDLDWSPDGRELAFIDFRYGRDPEACWLRTVTVATGDVTTLVSTSRSYKDEPPCYEDVAWSPSGTRIAYVTGLGYDSFADNANAPPVLYSVKPDGTKNRRLAALPLMGATDLFWLARGAVLPTAR